MRDQVKIKIADYDYTRFKSYRIEHNIYNAAAAWDFELYHTPGVTVHAGDAVQVYIDNALELTGLVDRVETTYGKEGIVLRVSGRDLMGLVIDSYVETWGDLKNVDLVALAERLLKDVPFICRKTIEADDAARKRDSAKPIIKTSPGQKIFDVLKEAALSRGVLFFAREDGGLCFRKPAGRGAQVLSITRNSEEPNHYIISGELVEDITNRYSKYTVLTQGDGYFSDERRRFNARATVEDERMKEKFYKPFVESQNNDTGSVKKRADALLEQRRAQSREIKYAVKGHSQGAFAWAVNELVKVDDDILNVHETLLIYGRTLEMSKENGILTHLILGEKGLVV